MLFVMIFAVAWTHTGTSEGSRSEDRPDEVAHISKEECRRLKDYCLKKGLNPEMCILVDFSEYSGNERLYIYDLNKNSIVERGRVAQGIGKKGSLRAILTRMFYSRQRHF